MRLDNVALEVKLVSDFMEHFFESQTVDSEFKLVL